MVKEIAGVANQIYHSIQASGTNAMFRANTLGKIVQKRTGHRSVEALHLYEPLFTEQHEAVSKVLMSNASYGEERRAEFEHEKL